MATRPVETQVHGMDLTGALGAPALRMPRTTTMAAEVLDELQLLADAPSRSSAGGELAANTL